MKIQKLIINNILSIEQADISFGDDGLVLVEGWNYDDGRANGAGKTAIFNALSFALFDDLPRKISASEILRDGAKSGFANAILEVDGDIYEVKRCRPNSVSFTVNGFPQTITQEQFETKIRLTYKQFLGTAYNSQVNSSRFIELNDSSKKEFLLKLMNLDDIVRCRRLVDLSIKELEKSTLELKTAITQDDAKVEVLNQSVPNLVNVNKKIALFKSEIETLNKELVEASHISKPDTEKFDLEEHSLSEKLSKIMLAKAKRSVLFDEFQKLANKNKPFSGKETCSECGTKLDLSSAKEHHEKEMEKLQVSMKELKLKIDTLDSLLAKEREIKTSIAEVRQSKVSQTSAYDCAQRRMDQVSSAIELKKSNVQTLQNTVTQATTILTKIKEIAKRRDASTVKLNDLNTDIAMKEVISEMYSPTGVSAYILDTAVATFNECISEYTGVIWPNATYILKTHRENCDGDIIAKFSEDLIINGKKKSVGSLSGGEYRALSLAIDFAISDVVFKNFSIDVNPVIMDEPFEGLDSVGKELVVDLLEKLALKRQIVVVDHASEIKALFSKVIRVEKRNGISTVT